jgi:hypothetical protein
LGNLRIGERAKLSFRNLLKHPSKWHVAKFHTVSNSMISYLELAMNVWSCTHLSKTTHTEPATATTTTTTTDNDLERQTTELESTATTPTTTTEPSEATTRSDRG